MKNMKKLLALALVIMSVFAIAAPAMAATQVSVSWVDATAIGNLGGMVSCIYSRQSENSAYVVKSFQNATAIQVKFDTNNMYWASAKYGTVTGYIPRHHFSITNSNLRVGMFSNSTLKRGFEGQPVRNLQMCLVSLGYGTNGIDGIYGPGTESAVTSFQRNNRMTPVDGIAGSDTKYKLLDLCALTD